MCKRMEPQHQGATGPWCVGCCCFHSTQIHQVSIGSEGPHPCPSCFCMYVHVAAGKSQQQRLAALNSFKSEMVPLLLATDVASRGLDIPKCGLGGD